MGTALGTAHLIAAFEEEQKVSKLSEIDPVLICLKCI